MRYQSRTWVKSRVREHKWLKAFRADAATEQHGLCRYCQEPLTSKSISADHVHPRSLGGTTKRGNIKAACRDCSMAKGSLSERAFLSAIKSPVPDAPLHILLAYMRRRIWVRTHRACERIERYAR